MPKLKQKHCRVDNVEASDSGKRGKYHKCCFAGCSRNKFLCPDLQFHRFPVSRKKTCEKWIMNCNNKSLQSIPYEKLTQRLVCEKHFTEDCYNVKNRLLPKAVPTLSVQDCQENELPKENDSTNKHTLEKNPKRKKQLVIVEWNDGVQNIVDVKDLKPTSKFKWSKKQIKGECNERVKMYYENKFHFGTIIVTDPKKIKEFEESFGKPPPMSSLMGGREEDESISCAEICIEKDEDEVPMHVETTVPTLDDSLGLDLLNTSVTENGEETTVIYEEFEEYEEKYEPQESDLNIIVSEVFSQTEVSLVNNIPIVGGESLNSDSQTLTNDVKFSYYEQEYGIKPCSVTLERCNILASPKNNGTKSNSVSNISITKSPVSNTSGLLHTIRNTNPNRKNKRELHQINKEKVPKPSKRMKLRLSSTVEKYVEKSTVKQPLVANSLEVNNIQLSNVTKESLENEDVFESQNKPIEMFNHLSPSKVLILSGNKKGTKRPSNKVSISSLLMTADSSVETPFSNNENSQSQISKNKQDTNSSCMQINSQSKTNCERSLESNCKDLEVINSCKNTFQSSFNKNNFMSSLMSSLNSASTSSFGSSPQSIIKNKKNEVSCQVKDQSFFTIDTFSFDFKSLFFNGLLPSLFTHKISNMFYPSGSKMSTNLGLLNNNTLVSPRLDMKFPFELSLHLVQGGSIANPLSVPVPQTTIMEIEDKQSDSSNELLDFTSDGAIPNSILDCSEKNKESKKTVNSENKTGLAVETLTPIVHLLPSVPKVSNIEVNLTEIKADETKNKCLDKITPDRCTGLKNGLFVTVGKGPIVSSKMQTTSSLLRNLSEPITECPVTASVTKTTPPKTGVSLQLVEISALADKPQTLLSCKGELISSAISSSDTTNKMQNLFSLKSKPSLSLKRPIATSTQSCNQSSQSLATTKTTQLSSFVTEASSLPRSITSKTPTTLSCETERPSSLISASVKSDKIQNLFSLKSKPSLSLKRPVTNSKTQFLQSVSDISTKVTQPDSIGTKDSSALSEMSPITNQISNTSPLKARTSPLLTIPAKTGKMQSALLQSSSTTQPKFLISEGTSTLPANCHRTNQLQNTSSIQAKSSPLLRRPASTSKIQSSPSVPFASTQPESLRTEHSSASSANPLPMSQEPNTSSIQAKSSPLLRGPASTSNIQSSPSVTLASTQPKSLRTKDYSSLSANSLPTSQAPNTSSIQAKSSPSLRRPASTSKIQSSPSVPLGSTQPESLRTEDSSSLSANSLLTSQAPKTSSIQAKSSPSLRRPTTTSNIQSSSSVTLAPNDRWQKSVSLTIMSQPKSLETKSSSSTLGSLTNNTQELLSLKTEVSSSLSESSLATAQTPSTSFETQHSVSLRRSPIKARKKKAMSDFEWECSPAKVSKIYNVEVIANSALSEKTVKSINSRTNSDLKLIPETYETLPSVSNQSDVLTRIPENKTKSVLILEQKSSLSKKLNKMVSDTKLQTQPPTNKLEISNCRPDTSKSQQNLASNSTKNSTATKVKPTSNPNENIQEPHQGVSEGFPQTPTSSKGKLKSASSEDLKKYITVSKDNSQSQNRLQSAKPPTLSQLLESAPPFIQEVFKCSNIRDGFINSDLIFVLSLLPDMDEMTASQKYSFQLKVIDLLTNVLDDPTLQIEVQR